MRSERLRQRIGKGLEVEIGDDPPIPSRLDRGGLCLDITAELGDLRLNGCELLHDDAGLAPGDPLPELGRRLLLKRQLVGWNVRPSEGRTPETVGLTLRELVPRVVDP